MNDQLRFTPALATAAVFDPAKHSSRFRFFLVDSSALLNVDAEPVLFGTLASWLRECKGKLVLTDQAWTEVQARLGSANRDRLNRLGELLRGLKSEGLLTFLETPKQALASGRAGGDVLLEAIAQFMQKRPLAMVTQDAALAKRAHCLGKTKAVEKNRKPFEVLCIENRHLRLWPEVMFVSNGKSRSKVLRGKALEQFIGEHCWVFADTCSLMFKARHGKGDGPAYFEQTLLPVMKSFGNDLIVPKRVVTELEENSVNPKFDAEKHDAAKAAVNVLHKFHKADRIKMPAEDDEVQGGSSKFADALFLRLAQRYQRSHSLCFITQDNALTRALLDLRDPTSPHRYMVAFLAQDGTLVQRPEDYDPDVGKSDNSDTSGGAIPGNEEGKKMNPGKSRVKRRRSESASSVRGGAVAQKKSENVSPGPEPFHLATRPRSSVHKVLPAIKLPVAGQVVMSVRHGNVTLGEEVAAGGEGTIFRCSVPGQVCKIYHADCRTQERLDKLNLMLSREVKLPGVSWPSSLVTNTDGAFLGYLMPEGLGKPLKTAVQSKLFLTRNFPQWQRKELTDLARRIVMIAEKLHRLNVLVGDVNPHNILVAENGNVCFVDVDSYQVGDFPCPVGTETFTSADRQGQDFKTFLRTLDDELFAFATLVFMVLFPGKAPFSAQGGGEIGENIRNHNFPYDPNNPERPPEGPWMFIWSHLPWRLKQNFIASFARDERISLAQWKKDLSQAARDIANGKAGNELFPTKPFIKEGQGVVVTCASCPPGKNEHEISMTLHKNLQAEGRDFRCKVCNGKRKLDWAQNTREVTCELRISPACLGTFSINKEYQDDLQANGKQVWCKPCREVQKQIWAAENAERQRLRASRRRSSSGCFVATAAYRNAEAPQVKWLRLYRDQVLETNRTGRWLSACYYRLGPWLAWPVNRSTILQHGSRIALNRLVARLAVNHPDLRIEPRHLTGENDER